MDSEDLNLGLPPLLFAAQPRTVEKGPRRCGDLLNVPNSRHVSLQCADGLLGLSFSYPGFPFHLISSPLFLSVFISPYSQSDDSLYHSIYFAWQLYLHSSPCLLGTGNYPAFSRTENIIEHSPYIKFFMFRVKSPIRTQDIFQEKQSKEDNPRAKRPLWLLFQLLPPNNHLAGFGMDLSCTLNLLPKWRRGQQSQVQRLQIQPLFLAASAGGPWTCTCISLPCTGQVTASAGTRCAAGQQLCCVSAMLQPHFTDVC